MINEMVALDRQQDFVDFVKAISQGQLKNSWFCCQNNNFSDACWS